jgi:hypothetical protein
VKRRIWDVDEEEGDVGEVLEGVGTKFHMNPTLHDLAHQYVLISIAIMTPWNCKNQLLSVIFALHVFWIDFGLLKFLA